MAEIVPINVKDPTLLFTITANGTVVDDLFPILSIEVFHEINRISYAEITIRDGTTSKASTGVIGDFPASDSNYFVPGSPLTITAGYGSSAEQSIFSGIIVKQSIQATENGFKLIVTAKHTAIKMTITKKDAVFMEQTDSAIMTTVTGNNGVSATVTSTSAVNELVFQKFSTDWDFLLARAEFNGFVVTPGDTQLTIGPPAVTGSPAVEVTFGESLIHFNAELSAEKQVPSVTATAWDPQTQTMLQSVAVEPGVNAQGSITGESMGTVLQQTGVLLVTNSPLVQENLQIWANSALLRARLQSIRGRVSFMGNAAALPNTLIAITGCGSRFDGNAYVTAVTHTLKDGKWTSTAKFGLDPKPIFEKENFSYAPSNGQLPAIQGLQLGEVVAISQDPGAEYRVQVKLASNAEGQTGTWARLSTFYATAAAGAFFYPEVGDEVVVGFLENDPRFPVIMGTLYSKLKTPPVTPADNNNYIKALYTKSLMKITFDDQNKILSIITPAGNTITLSDQATQIEIKDQNSNSVTLSSSGIAITSASNIEIKANGTISMNAPQGITIESPAGTVGVSALNISNTATAAITCSGNTSAELSSSAATIIQGGVVMIN